MNPSNESFSQVCPPVIVSTSPTQGIRRVPAAEAAARVRAIIEKNSPLHAAPAPRAPVPLDFFAYEALDAAVLARLAPQLPPAGVFRLACSGTAPVTVAEDGVDFLRLTPTDPQDAVDVPREVFRALVNTIGSDVMPKPSERFASEAEDWASRVLAATPVSLFEQFSGVRATFLEGVQARLVQSFAVSRETAERITGAPVKLTHGLWPAGKDFARLAALDDAAKEAALAAVVATEAALIEAARPRTVGELGAEIIAVRMADAPDARPPFEGATLLWSTTEDRFYGFTALPGAPLPSKGYAPGVRLLAQSDCVARECVAIPAPTSEAANFARFMVTRHGKGTFGPVKESWTLAGRVLAESFLAQHVTALLRPTVANGWMARHLAEVCVRGLRLRPDVAEALMREAIDREDARRTTPVRIPKNGRTVYTRGAGPTTASYEAEMVELPRPVFSSDVVNATFAKLCIDAAAAGCVSVGCLLEPEPPPRKTKAS